MQKLGIIDLARLRQISLIITTLLVFVSSVQATNYREDSFEYFATPGSESNTDDSVFIDLHIKEKKKLVLINGEVITPVEYSDGDSFKLQGSVPYDTYIGGYDSADTWDGLTFLPLSVNTTEKINVFIGDFNGDGHSDQLLQSNIVGMYPDRTLIMIYGSNNRQPSAVETITNPLTYLGYTFNSLNAVNSKINVGDFNNDGISDIEVEYTIGIYANQYKYAVAYGGSQGLGEVNWTHANGPSYTSSKNSPSAVKPNNGTLVPGGTSGSFRVSESGAATFTLPIFSPKGPAGITTGLSLGYSSQGGNGPLGKGWSINAGAAINTCPATEFQHVDTSLTQFCLNGSRLIQLTGTDSAVRTYATEVADISKIIGYFASSDSDLPTSFDVYKKDGTKHNFTQMGEVIWALDKVWNPSQSAYTQYEYLDVGTGTYKKTPSGLSRVSIKTKDDVVVSQTDFIYESRPDTSSVYMGGDLKNLNQRINKITVKAGAQAVRSYHLAYDRSKLTGASTLKYIQECGLQSQCYEPITFNWTKKDLLASTGTNDNFSDDSKTLDLDQVLTGDFNKDGYQDLLLRDDQLITMRFGKAGGVWDKPSNWGYWGNLSTNIGEFTESATATRKVMSLDLNNDGYTDVAVLDVVRTASLSQGRYVFEVRLTPYISNGLGLSPYISAVSPLEVQPTKIFRTISYNGSVAQAFQNLSLIDLNADGLVDLTYLAIESSSYFLYGYANAYLQKPNTGDSVEFYFTAATIEGYELHKPLNTRAFGIGEAYTLGIWDADTLVQTHDAQAQFIDLNNDGYIDLLFRGGAVTNEYWKDAIISEETKGWYVAYSLFRNSKGFDASVLDAYKLPMGIDDKFIMADFNGDGFIDIHTDTNLILNTGRNGFVSTAPKLKVAANSTPPGYGKTINSFSPIDGNTDGISDFAIVEEGQSSFSSLGYNEGGDIVFYDLPTTMGTTSEDPILSTINMDVNGDGTQDILVITKSGQVSTRIIGTADATENSEPADVINSIVSSNGIETKIEYGRGIVDASLYQPDEDASQTRNPWTLDAPVFDVTGAVHLVKRVTDDAPTMADPSASVSKRYSYVGGKLQAGGRGFLGFRKLIVIDETFNVKTVTEYAQQFPYQGMPLYTYKVKSVSGFDDAGITGFISDDIYEPSSTSSTQSGFSALSNINAYGNVTTGMDTVCRDAINAGSDADLTWLSCARNILNVKEFATATTQHKYNPVYPYIETVIEEVFHTRTEFDVTPQFDDRGGILKSIITTSTYAGEIDAFYGDITSQVMVTNVLSGDFIISHVTLSEFKYDSNDASKWWLGRLTEQLVTSRYTSGQYDAPMIDTGSDDGGPEGRSGNDPAPAPVYVAGTSFSSLENYDLSYLGSYLDDPRSSVERKTTFAYSPTTGVLKSSTVEPDNSELSVTTTYVYDSWGNKESVTKQSGVDESSELYFWRKAETTYDANGVYPTHVYEYTSEGSKRLTSTVNSRNALGQPLSITGQNGVSSSKEYDGFGRVTSNASSLGSYSEISYGFCSADIYCPNASLGNLVVSKTSNAAPSQKTYSDKWGQTLRASTRSFDGNWIHVDNQYDKIGRVLKTSNPFTASEADYWTSYDYDIFGRAIRAVYPNNTTLATQYDGFYTTSTDHLGLSKSSLTNAIGDTVYIKEFTSDDTAETVLKEIFYKYDLQGNTTQVVGDGSTITTGYNLIGQAINTQDPVKGTWTYSRNALGELIHQTNANGEVTRNSYDDLGRIKTRTIKSGVTVLESTNWNYDGASNGLGKIDSISGQFSYAGIGTSYAYGFTYNTDAQLATKTTTIDGTSYKEKWTYDSIGRSDVHYDASNGNTSTPTNGTKTHYNNYNYVSGLSDATGNHYYFTPLATDDFGNITQFQYGNGVISTANYDDVTGRLRNLSAGKNSNNDEILDYFYQYDAVGNLDYKQDANLGYTEDMRYDTTYRLTDVVSTGFFTDAQMGAVDDYNLSITYMAGSSRIATKSNYENGTAYTYGGATSCNAGQCDNHVLTSVGALEFAYDKQGNRLSETRNSVQERSAQYTAYDKPWSITKGSNTSNFAYGASGQRIKQIANTDGVAKTIRYVGGVEWIDENNNNSWTYKRRIAGYALEEQQADATVKRSYLHKDYQGSVVAITNDTGVIQQRLSYDVYGARRDVLYNHATGYIKPGASFYDQIGVYTYNGELAAAVRQVALDSRGYTGHEHLDGVGLIHMNGRVFDPLSALFLSADPHIPDASDQYSLNRFSYTRNRPVNFTDPSGYFDLNPVKAIQHLGRKADRFVDWAGREMDTGTGKLVISIAITYFTAGYGYGWAMAGGFASGYVATGTLKGAAIGAIFAGASYGVGSLAGNISNTAVREAARATMHGFLGGIRSQMAGGSFSSGFKAAGLATVVSHAGGFAKAGITTKAGRIVAAAVIGGTVSEMSGGKFANGAISAAFAQAYNDENHPVEKKKVSLTEAMSGMESDAALELYKAARDDINTLEKGLKLGSMDERYQGKAIIDLRADLAQAQGNQAGSFIKTILGGAVDNVEYIYAHKTSGIGGAIKGQSVYSNYELGYNVNPRGRSNIYVEVY